MGMGSVATLTKPTIVPLDPAKAASTEYPITTYQPKYFCAQSLHDAKERISIFCDTLTRPFFPQYDPLTQNIHVSKAVARLPRTSTLELQREKQRQYSEQLHSKEQPSVQVDQIAQD